MSRPHELRCYEYVNRPYVVVRDAVRADPYGILGRATTGAAHRAGSVAANLRLEIGGLELAKAVTIQIARVAEEKDATGELRTELELAWAAESRPELFPKMRAVLRIYPLASGETQLELRGTYEPPLGLLGQAIDAAGLHRVADASVHRFVTDVAALLKAELPTRPSHSALGS